MRCMLDTDTVSYLLNRSPRMKPRVPMKECCMSTIVLGELEFGAANSSRPDELRQLFLDFTSSVRVLPVDEAVTAKFSTPPAETRDD